MKRKQYGINFDLGVPLQSPEEFQLLYVELHTEQEQRLIDWIKDENEGSIIAAGQIGTGKTTLIEKAFQEAAVNCDVRIKLDEEVPLYVPGAFWGVFLGKTIELALKLKCNLKDFQLSEDLIGIKYSDSGLKKLTAALCKQTLSISDFREKKKLFHLIDENIEIIRRQAAGIIKIIENKIKRKPFIFAEGIDKFGHYTADYISLLDLLNFLSPYKTLYEVNLIHLFGSTQKWHNSKKIFVTAASNQQINEILSKRLGVYSKSRAGILPLLAGLSGGNIRQALRLLIEYDFAVENMKKDKKDALDYTCRRVREDLISIPEGGFESELLKVVNKDKYISSGILKDFAGRKVSQNAIYHNWILILNDADKELKWPAVVNPLLLPAIQTLRAIPESPETNALKEWAEAHDVSPFGLEIDVSKIDRPGKLFDLISSSELPSMLLNIMEIFDNMAAYFLNPDRKDKIIIAYKDKELVKLANDFIIGKAGTYKPGNFKDLNYDEIPGGQLYIFLSGLSKEQYDGYSIFFEKQLTPPELMAMDQRRDALIDYKMIWWFPYNDLKGYLKYWPQLRQFFNIFHLEEDVLGNISKKEIEEDLEDIEGMAPSQDPSKGQLKERLQRVLNYLKKREDEQ
jgi:hypothetical protein